MGCSCQIHYRLPSENYYASSKVKMNAYNIVDVQTTKEKTT